MLLACLFRFSLFRADRYLLFVQLSSSPSDPYTHMLGATCGELMACIFRVPTENLKQKMQVQLVMMHVYPIGHTNHDTL